MTLKEFYYKYDEVKVVIDLNKNLMQFHMGNFVSKPVFVRTDTVCIYELFEVKGVLFSVHGFDVEEHITVSVIGTNDKVEVPIENSNIDYDTKGSSDSICERLDKMSSIRDKVVREIIAYFSQVDITYKHPCIIENPNDAMAGGVAIKGIRKGVAIEDVDDCEGSYYDIDQLDDETLIRLWDWIEWGSNNEPKF